jgi:hypothetical protein
MDCEQPGVKLGMSYTSCINSFHNTCQHHLPNTSASTATLLCLLVTPRTFAKTQMTNTLHVRYLQGAGGRVRAWLAGATVSTVRAAQAARAAVWYD